MGFCLLSACGGISHEFFLPMPGVLSTFSGSHSVKLTQGKLCSKQRPPSLEYAKV